MIALTDNFHFIIFMPASLSQIKKPTLLIIFCTFTILPDGRNVLRKVGIDKGTEIFNFF